MSSSQAVVLTAPEAPGAPMKSTHTPRASLKAAASSSTSSRGVKRSVDDCLAETSSVQPATGHVQKHKRPAVKLPHSRTADIKAVPQTIQQEMINGLTNTCTPVASAVLPEQRTPTVRGGISSRPQPKVNMPQPTQTSKVKVPQPKKELKPKALPPKKEPKARQEPKPKKVSKASMVRAKMAEVSIDPYFQRLGPDAVKRIKKVYMDRLYLIHRHRHGDTLKEEFDVYGSTGNIYKVTLAERLMCSCIDFTLRRNACKHMLFIYLKVLRLPSHMPIYSQKALTEEELRFVFAEARQNPVAEAMASTDLRKAWESVVGYKAGAAAASTSKSVIETKPVGKRLLPTEGDACGVCYEDLEPGSEEGLEFCLTSCGRPIHKDCLATWINSRSYGPPTCIWCRAVWHDAPQNKSDAKKKADRTANGYGIGTSDSGFVIDRNTGLVLNLAHVVDPLPAFTPY